MPTLKVILADSNELIRVGLRTVLNSQSGVEIVGEVTDNDELLDLIKNFGTDVVLIDYTSSGFSIDIIPKIISFIVFAIELTDVHCRCMLSFASRFDL